MNGHLWQCNLQHNLEWIFPTFFNVGHTGQFGAASLLIVSKTFFFFFETGVLKMCENCELWTVIPKYLDLWCALQCLESQPLSPAMKGNLDYNFGGTNWRCPLYVSWQFYYIGRNHRRIIEVSHMFVLIMHYCHEYIHKVIETLGTLMGLELDWLPHFSFRLNILRLTYYCGVQHMSFNFQSLKKAKALAVHSLKSQVLILCIWSLPCIFLKRKELVFLWVTSEITKYS